MSFSCLLEPDTATPNKQHCFKNKKNLTEKKEKITGFTVSRPRRSTGNNPAKSRLVQDAKTNQ